MKKINITLKKIESTPAVPAVKKSDALSETFPWPAEITEIIEACRKNSYILINDHNKKPEEMRIGVWLHRNGVEATSFYEDWYVVVLPKDGSMCCLNEVYIGRDGVPHLSQRSVGDNVWAGFPNRGYHPEQNLKEGMEAYNWFYLGTEEAHGHPVNRIGWPDKNGVMIYDPTLYDNRLVYAEGRHEKFVWNEDTEEVKKIRF